MIKREPANLKTPIENITEHNLLYRLLIGIEGLQGTRVELDREIIKLPLAVHEFMHNKDHGLDHSKKVLARCREITKQCPYLMHSLKIKGFDPITIDQLFTWASILHDLTRFMGYESLSAHQLAGANLARSAFNQNTHDAVMGENLAKMVICHDYLCYLVHDEPLPSVFKLSPLAEIFRLADKTSLPPDKEIYRYYLTGKRHNGIFFKSLHFNLRINFAQSCLDGDMLTWFLILFAIQPDDFHFLETQALYRKWSLNKPRAAKKIIELAKQEKMTPEQIEEITQVIIRFHRYIEQPNPFKH